jgi:hypothetical protein
MTEVPGANKPANDAKNDAKNGGLNAAPSEKPLDEWKPEPRQWSWKDLFTAPMLSFKPKCMLISALTLLLITGWMWLSEDLIIANVSGMVLPSILAWVQMTVAIVLFSLGASLVAVFMKADLLDDEFLSLSEALTQYKSRILPAVLVPIFLMLMAAGAYVALVYLPVLASSIPFVGPTFYALLYPLLFLFSVFVFLLTIAVWLSIFVFPAIIAIRKHSWFDNVVDTIEAVGTKPHVLFGSLLLTGVMIWVFALIGFGGIQQLKQQYVYLPDSFRANIKQTENRASDVYAGDMVNKVNNYVFRKVPFVSASLSDINPHRTSHYYRNQDEGSFQHYFTGPVAGFWQIVIQALIFGYLINLFVSGGMLTYLVVREDDYWDDEDLEDLDKLAKELEEEAKRDQGLANEAKPIEPTANAEKAPEAPANDATKK